MMFLPKVKAYFFQSIIPHVCRSEACVMLRCRGRGTDSQSAVCARPLPVVRIVLHNVVGFHAVVKHGHQQLEEHKDTMKPFVFSMVT